MGTPVASLPALTLVSTAGKVDLGTDTDIDMIEKIYDGTNFDFEKDWLTGQTAANYLLTPAVPVAGIITGLTSPEGQQLVAVYHDSKGGLQVTGFTTSPRIWNDVNLPGGVLNYYQIVVVKETDYNGASLEIFSPPSTMISGKAIDTAPVIPPLLSVSWVVNSGTKKAEINWSSEHEVMIQRKDDGTVVWVDLAQWRPPGTVTIRDPFSDPAKNYAYRAIAKKYNGAVAKGALVNLAANP